ncbi:MAG: hypothetical protein JWN65_4199 [Solirubrobacterales bacterium]|nr:hypothetical protein [Solirubrobacterales bacterium]
MTTSQSPFQLLLKHTVVPSDSRVSKRRATYKGILDDFEHTMANTLEQMDTQPGCGQTLGEVLASRVTWAQVNAVDVVDDRAVLSDMTEFVAALKSDVHSADDDDSRYEAVGMAIEDLHSFLLARNLVGVAYRAVQSGLPIGDVFRRPPVPGAPPSLNRPPFPTAGDASNVGNVVRDVANSHVYVLAA